MPTVKERTFLLLIMLLAIVIAVLLVGKFVFTSASDGYSAVYLRTGEVYVGKLSHFPKMKLTDAYLMGNPTSNPENPDETNLQLTPTKNFVWSPSVLYITRDQVVFYGPVGESSQVGEALQKVNNQ